MREILFRGKQAYNDEWAYSEYPFGTIHCGAVVHDFIPETIGQYTGLTDKNGTKIFEGDIVEGHCHSQWSHRLQRCVVEYDRGNFEARHYVEQGGVMRYYSYKVLFSKDVVVIGNIHDNPELLKGEEENA